MEVIDRRRVLTGIICGAAVATVGLHAGATAVAAGAAGGIGDGGCVVGAGNQPAPYP